MSVYKLGSRGEEVKQIQTALGLIADGIFGKGTEMAVKKFQEINGLIPDGIVGRKTFEKLIPKFDTDLSPIIVPKTFVDIEEYHLPKKEYLNGKYQNSYIILHHTAGWDNPKQVVDSWSTDSLGRVATEFVIGGQRTTDGRNTYDGKVIRSYPEGNQGYHIGASGSSFMNTHSVGVELCNMGYIKNNRTYVNTAVMPEQIVTLEKEFRGYKDWHRYSDKQLNVLHDLLLYIADRDNIDLHTGLYQWIKSEGVKAFDARNDAYNGKVKGLLSHGNIRCDKFDVFPQPELIDMILTL